MTINLSEHPVGTVFLTRDGRRARLVANDILGRDEQFVVAVMRHDSEAEDVGLRFADGRTESRAVLSYDIVSLAPTAVRVRVVVGGDDGRRYVLSCLEGDERFDRPAERFLTCDRVLADEIVEIEIVPQPVAAPLKPMVIPENLRRGMPDPPDGENGGKHDWQRGSKCYRITPAGRSALDGGAR